MSFLKPIAAAALIALPNLALAESFEKMFPGHPPTDYPEVDAILKNLDYKHGTIRLPGQQATLTVPQGYYFLDAHDAQTVLTDLWGNPPSDATLGMIFPASGTPFEAWGVEFTWDGMGYVSDEDADSYDYDAVLRDMQADTRAESSEREANGYDSVELVGWAQAPTYDKVERKLHWALELEFAGDPDHVLNYQLRALGRKGVLQATFIAEMTDLPDIRESLPDVAAMIAFNPGKTYADFDPSLDTVAAVGVGGLIAGKVAAKAGLFAFALLLLKKAWFVLLLPFIWLKNLFTSRRV